MKTLKTYWDYKEAALNYQEAWRVLRSQALLGWVKNAKEYLHFTWESMWLCESRNKLWSTADTGPLQFKSQKKTRSSLCAVKRQEWKGKQFREYLILAELKPAFYWNIEKDRCWLKVLSCRKQYASKRKEAVTYYPCIWGCDLPAIVIAAKVMSTEIEAILWKILVLLFSSTSHNVVVVFLLLGQP